MRKSDAIFRAVVSFCLLLILAGGGYLFYHYALLPRKLQAENARYAALYVRAQQTPAPSPEPLPEQTVPPTWEPVISPAPKTPVPEAPAQETTAEPETPAPVQQVAEDARRLDYGNVADQKLGTADPDTYISAAITPPPPQESFRDLLTLNPDTAGYLALGEEIRLPVVWRPGDNETYLTHNFEGEESDAGCLFLDGAGRIYPRDDCLYVYGHNMKNGAMFGHLSEMSTVAGLKRYSPVTFDTLYENDVYVPFACLQLTASLSDGEYFEIRRFDLTEDSFGDFVAQLKVRSLLDIPIDAVYGDQLLMLVTCNYGIGDGRFAVALRALRTGETAENAMRLVELAVEK